VRIEALVPVSLRPSYRRLRSYLKNRAWGRSNVQIFDEIYRLGAWGRGDNSPIYSGPGTYDASVSNYIQFVRSFIEAHNITSILEIGCGDFAIGRHYAGLVQSYVGVDISSIVVRTNTERFASEKIQFVQADASKCPMPPTDLCIIRQVLQHLDNRTIVKLLRNTTRHKYVLVTEHLPSHHKLRRANLNKCTGPDTRLHFDSGVYVELAPFGYVAETVLALPVESPQFGQGEIMRTSLISN
jgi:SAM-dependent methyltransferase